jgi:ribose transport system substrate-binding protein
MTVRFLEGRRKQFFAVALVALTLVSAGMVTACGGVAGGGDSGKKKVAVLLWSQGFEFMVALGQGIKDEAKKLDVEVTVLDAQADSANQISQIEDQIAAGVDGFVLSPVNSEELVPGVERINEADIPVVTVDSIMAGGKVDSAIAYDNVAAGEMGATYLGEELMGGKGTALEYEGAQGAFHAIRRGDGFKKGIAAFPDIKRISRDSNWTADKALTITADVLSSDDSITGLFSHNDEMIKGIVSGLRQIGKDAKAGQDGHVAIVGVDGTPLALDRIRDGSQDATVDQDPFVMGSLAMASLVKVLNGEKLPKEQLTPPKMITPENVDDPKLWGNKFKG